MRMGVLCHCKFREKIEKNSRKIEKNLDKIQKAVAKQTILCYTTQRNWLDTFNRTTSKTANGGIGRVAMEW